MRYWGASRAAGLPCAATTSARLKLVGSEGVLVGSWRSSSLSPEGLPVNLMALGSDDGSLCPIVSRDELTSRCPHVTLMNRYKIDIRLPADTSSAPQQCNDDDDAAKGGLKNISVDSREQDEATAAMSSNIDEGLLNDNTPSK